jgi:hypothetical protein
MRAAIVGVVLQIALAIAAHLFVAVVKYYFLFSGMMISATAGYLYAMGSGKGYFPGATGGAIVGGISAFIGIGALVLMHDAAPDLIPTFTAICVLTGAVGGLFGQVAVKLRGMGF